MRDVSYAITLIAAGMMLIVYAHATFATKAEVVVNSEYLKRIDKRVYDMHRHFIK